MIEFQKVRWRNMFSYGQDMTEVQLNRSPSTMILGKNGSGKSAFTDALVFGLFGKPFRKIKKDQMINTKNGRDALVEVEFVADGIPYKVRRGIKPGIFEIFKDGELLNQPGSSRDYQRFLETTILKMDYEAACQIVFVGKAQHTTFMQLDSGKRRRFVEVILNLVVFSNMSKIHYNRCYELRNKLQDLKAAVMVASEKVKLRERYIADLEQAELASAEHERKKIDDKLTELEGQLAELIAKSEALEAPQGYSEADHKAAIKKYQDGIRMIDRMTSKVSDLTRELQKMGDVPICPTCGQSVDAELHHQHKAEKHTKLDELSEAIQGLQTNTNKLADMVARFEELETAYNAFLKEQRAIEFDIGMIRDQQARLQDEMSKVRTSHGDKIEEAKRELADLSDLHQKLVDKYQKTQELYDYMQMIGTMLQDKGIKTMLIRRFIPIINHAVNQHLAQLGLFVKFELDENFDETIHARGIDLLGYNSYSEGEKLRMDMALLLAWRDIARLQGNVSTNLLIFDEIFDSSLDTTGAEALADLLGVFQGLNVFIITHTPEKIAEKVRSIIKIERHEGFSRIAKWEEKE